MTTPDKFPDTSSRKFPEIARLASALCDGQMVSAAELDQLDRLLLDDADAQQYYRQHVSLHMALAWQFADRGFHSLPGDLRKPSAGSVATEPAPPPFSFLGGTSLGDLGRRGFDFFSNHTLLFSLFAALLLGSLAAAIGLSVTGRTGSPSVAYRSAKADNAGLIDSSVPDSWAVARLVRSSDCHWTNPATALAAGDELSVGQEIDLAAGRAEIAFACDTRVVLFGPSVLRVESPKAVRLALGHAMARAGSARGHGFSITTRTAAVIDLGTEFHVQAAPDGHSQVTVTVGAVEVRPCYAATGRRVEAGQTAQIEPGEAGILTLIEGGNGTPAFKFPTIEPPSNQDYADASQHHAKISVVDGQLSGGSGPITALLDGHAPSEADSHAESPHFATNEHNGKIMIDLGRAVMVRKVNTYSWHTCAWVDAKAEHRRARAPQRYVLYGFAGNRPPPVKGDPAVHGWRTICRVDTDEHFTVPPLENRPPQQAVSITGANGEVGRYRYLLWHVRPTHAEACPSLDGHPADCPPKCPTEDVNTFYGEFDVYADEGIRD
jgi:hypothetical protein